MNAEFLERMNHISSRVASVLEESENLKKLISERISKNDEKPYISTDSDLQEDTGSEIEYSRSICAYEDDADDENDEYAEDEDEDDSDNEEAEDDEEAVYDTELSGCWKCLFGGRR